MRIAAEMGGQIGPGASDDHPGRIPWAERHLKWLFWACAAGLAPWVVYLYLSQVPRATAHQIHLLAAGLILAMIAVHLFTPLAFTWYVLAGSAITFAVGYLWNKGKALGRDATSIR